MAGYRLLQRASDLACVQELGKQTNASKKKITAEGKRLGFCAVIRQAV